MTILHSPTFRKNYKRLPSRIKDLAESKESLFKVNPFSPQLKTHKLVGDLEGYWAFSINYRYRIIFQFIDDNTVKFVIVGGHEIYN